MFRKLITIYVLIVCIFSLSAHAFNDTITHRELTKTAVNNSSLNNYLVTFVGYSSGVKTVLNGINRKGNNSGYIIERWLQEGSTDEDSATFCRASNHFHNPIYTGDWLESQMSDSLTVDLACGTSHRYSNVTWATGFKNPLNYIGTRTGQNRNLLGLYDAPQEMGWDDARIYFYDALTTKDPAAKEAQFVRTFRTNGTGNASVAGYGSASPCAK